MVRAHVQLTSGSAARGSVAAAAVARVAAVRRAAFMRRGGNETIRHTHSACIAAATPEDEAASSTVRRRCRESMVYRLFYCLRNSRGKIPFRRLASCHTNFERI